VRISRKLRPPLTMPARFYETLIYGRRGDVENGEGIALCKVTGAKSKKPVFGLITFGFPILTARAVPQLKDFMQTNGTMLSLQR
jgi:hypothetical protein